MIESVPQGLKPSSIRFSSGTAESVPFVQIIFPQPARVPGSHALYQGPTLVGPQRGEKELGFSPCGSTKSDVTVPSLAKRITQLQGMLDHDTPPHAEQHGREHFQPIAPAAQTRTASQRLSGHSPRRKCLFRILDGHVDPDIDLVVRLDERHAVRR